MKLVKIEGMEQVIANIKSLPNDRMKRSKILQILRRQMKPVLSAVKLATPESDENVKFRNEVIQKGNLKRSMAIKTSPLKNYPSVLVGPRMGSKQKFDGWYAFFLQYGTYRIKPDDFIGKAASPLMNGTQNQASKELERYITKEAQKL
jgi:hypothetical protein